MKFIPTAVVAAMAAAAFSTSVQAEALLSFEGHSYFLTPNASTWDEAEAQAVAMGGHLVAILLVPVAGACRLRGTLPWGR